MSSAGKKIEYSLTFLLFKEKKKCFLPPHHLASKKFIHQFFSLFLKKWKKRKLIQEDARPFQIKKN